jgi:hypothetical protein
MEERGVRDGRKVIFVEIGGFKLKVKLHILVVDLKGYSTILDKIILAFTNSPRRKSATALPIDHGNLKSTHGTGLHEGRYGTEDSPTQVDESRANSNQEMYTSYRDEWNTDTLQEENQLPYVWPPWAKSHGRSWNYDQ